MSALDDLYNKIVSPAPTQTTTAVKAPTPTTGSALDKLYQQVTAPKTTTTNPVSVVQANPTQTISGVVPAQPTQQITGVVQAQPKQSISNVTQAQPTQTVLPPKPAPTPTFAPIPNLFSVPNYGNSATTPVTTDKSFSPATVGNFAKDVAQGTARSGVSVGATINKMFGGSDTLNPNQGGILGGIETALVGNEPVKSLDTRILEAIPKVQEFAKKYAGKDLNKFQAAGFATPTILGLTALDFSGAGGEKSLFKELAKAGTAEDVLKLLKKANVSEELAKIYAPRLVEETRPEVIGNLLKNIQETQKITAVKPGVIDIAKPTLRERGLLTSLKENPETQAVFKDVQDLYAQKPNVETVAKARTLIDQTPEEAKALAYSDNISADAQATRITLIKDAIARGDITEARKLGSEASLRGTEAGQAAQVNAILGQNIDTPEKAIVTAAGQIEDANKARMPKFASKVDKVGKEIDKLHNEAVDTIIKETPELKPKLKLPPLQQKIEAKIARGGVPPAEELASRITPYYKAKAPNPIKDMVNTLYKLAQEQLPAKGVKPPRDAIELIGKALRDKVTYADIWKQAQEIVKTKWAENPEATQLLEKYLGKGGEFPVATKQINTAVQQGIKAESIDLGKLVRQHFTVVDQTGKDLTAKLIEKANIPASDASALASKIQKRFNDLVSARKATILKQIFADRKIAADKEFVAKIIEWSNLGAFDKPTFRDQIAKKLGLTTLTDDLTKKLIDQANIIQQIPYGYERFKQTQNLLEMISNEIPKTKAEIAGQILNLPRTLISSFFDFSFGFKQGIFTAPSFPKEFGSAFKKQFGAFASEKNYENLMDVVMKNPDFQFAEQSGLAFTDVSSKMGAREERYMSSLAEKIPILGIGKGVKMTSRAYTGMANKLRMDVFASILKDAQALGLDPHTDKFLAKEMAEFVNNATGRGSKLMGLDVSKASPLLNALFFSPRLMASRTTLLNPAYYITADPFVRKQALKSLFYFAGTVGTVLGLAKLSGAQVGVDPRSADFAKIKIGNTRIDIAGGFQQWVRMASQLLTGKYISSTTGKEYTLGEGYRPLTRKEILYKQFETKEAPVAAFITKFLGQEKDNPANQFHLAPEVSKMFVPMIASDIYDLAKNDPKLLPLVIPATFGVGLQTYAPLPPAKPKKAASGRTNRSSTRKSRK